METIEFDDEKFPDSLRNIKSSPKKLYVEGNSSLLKYIPSITVIGSRNMTNYGKEMTQKIVNKLVENNVCIISGMAVGIDSVAHRTCINKGGKTIAVLGCGLNKIFPPQNIDLFNQIVNSGGCVISEYSPETIAQKQYFPLRNRIVSGLSLATLVIEATYRSGTSITAKFAFDQGKKVYCIPNGIGSKNSAGTINLLKKGAKIVTCAEDILIDLGIYNKKLMSDNEELLKEKQILDMEEYKLKGLDEVTKQVYYCIKENEIINSELLAYSLNLSVQEVNVQLSILELKGLIVENGMMNFGIVDEMRF